MLDLSHTLEGEHGDVRVRGELDIYTGPQLTDLLGGLLEAGVTDVVLDLSDVEFMDSSGLSTILAAHKHLEAKGGSLVVQEPSPFVVRLLDLTGLKDVLGA